MLWLQSDSIFDIIAEFEPDSIKLNKMSRKELGSLAPKKYHGSFYEFSDGLFILYHDQKDIYFVSNGRTFILDDYTMVDVSGSEKQRMLEVIKDGNVIYSTFYIPNYDEKIENDPTPFIDDEDFDFGLFVSNISKDSQRKSIIING